MRRPLLADPAGTVSPRGPEKPLGTPCSPCPPGSGVRGQGSLPGSPDVPTGSGVCSELIIHNSCHRKRSSGGDSKVFASLSGPLGAGAAARETAGYTGGAGRVWRPSLGPQGSAECSPPECPGAAVTKDHRRGGFRQKCWLFPGGPVAKTRPSQCRSPGSTPGQGTRSHMLQLRPAAENINISRLINLQRSSVLPLLTRQSLHLSPQPPVGRLTPRLPTQACQPTHSVQR